MVAPLQLWIRSMCSERAHSILNTENRKRKLFPHYEVHHTLKEDRQHLTDIPKQL